MNIGQVLELHLGMAARELRYLHRNTSIRWYQDVLWGTVAEAGMARR